MDASSPERAARRTLLLGALAAGIALGNLVLAGGSLVLFDASGLLTATTGLVVTVLVALIAGLWAGAPAGDVDDLPVRERWVAAGLATGVAGVFATYLVINESLARSAVGRMSALLLLIAVPVYTLGMVLPVLLEWAQRHEDEQGTAVLTLGVLAGVVVGTLLSGLVLLASAGPGPLLLGTAALLLVPLWMGEPDLEEAEEEIVFEADTPFHTLRVTQVIYPGDRQPERRLYLNGEEESGELVRSGAPTLAYIAAAESWLTAAAPRGGSYLFLGGGAYTLPRRMAERDPRARITVVELDPDVTRAAYHFFGLRPEHGVRSVHGDARAYIDRASETGAWDRVYMDVYGGAEALPYPLVTREAFEGVRRLLRPGGVAALNVIGVTDGSEAPRLWSVVRTFAEVFPSVALYTHLGPDYPERQNLLLAGTAEPGATFAPKAGPFDPWPRESWPVATGTVVFRDLFPDRGAPTPRDLPPRPPLDPSREPRGERSAHST